MSRSRVHPTTVKQDDNAPVPKEILATAIVKISESMTALRKSGLNRVAIVALVKDDCGVPKSTIVSILDSLENLRRNYAS